MSQNLKIQVLLNAIDKLTAPFRSASKQIKSTSSAIKANKNLLKKLESAQERVKKTGLPQAQERLKNKIEQTTQAIKKQNQALDRLNKQAKKQAQYDANVKLLKKANQFTSNFGQSSMMHGAAVLGGGSFAMKPALNFEEEFSRVQSLTRLDKTKDAEKIKQLRDQAKHLGATTSFTSGDVAAGQSYLAMAGFNQRQILDSMPSILNMTKAAGMEMGRVSDISSDISSGFKIPAEEMNRVADVLTLTFTSSNTNLELLGETMKYLGPIASSTGQDFETMSAMVGLLGNVGIKGSQAGTSLRAAMLRLAGPPKQAKEALDKLGVSAKDAKGNMRSMTDILIDVSKKTEKMGSAKKMEYYKAIFGAEAATAMVELVNQAGTKGIQEFAEQLKNASGTAEKVAKTMSDNVIGDLKNLQSVAESISISIFDETNSEIREMIQLLSGALREINEWIKQNPKLTATIMKWFAGLGLGLVVIGALNLALSYLFYPVWRMILLLSKLSEAWTFGKVLLFGKTLADGSKKAGLFAKAGNLLGRVWKAVPKVFSTAWKFVVMLGQNFVKYILLFGKTLISVIPKIMAFSAALFTNPIFWVIAGIVALIAGLYLLWKHWDKVKKALIAGWNWVSQIFEQNPILNVLFPIVPLIKGIIWVIQNWGGNC
ncbi:TP901 family phage tail tape measure protein [Canicola haemoglobinophilus]|uniref:TP901 family phage tail tape measure protein n=1 Tax=Canicola haemoglobinophilus TaxID=733 RepID=A0AB38H9F9_9PAST|nr:phage tail tape measure protein [Canicola haemoglobinophilus]STO54364.1 TP901 family phage tail tape measure protein [Canicola haemoglobinophilus]STO68898.1 TP901 family phage tail tape measure protein [Canicola haemoglobinophilus]